MPSLSSSSPRPRGALASLRAALALSLSLSLSPSCAVFGEGVACSADANCPNGRSCVDGLCAPVPDTRVEEPGHPALCERAADCGGDPCDGGLCQPGVLLSLPGDVEGPVRDISISNDDGGTALVVAGGFGCDRTVARVALEDGALDVVATGECEAAEIRGAAAGALFWVNAVRADGDPFASGYSVRALAPGASAPSTVATTTIEGFFALTALPTSIEVTSTLLYVTGDAGGQLEITARDGATVVGTARFPNGAGGGGRVVRFGDELWAFHVNGAVALPLDPTSWQTAPPREVAPPTERSGLVAVGATVIFTVAGEPGAQSVHAIAADGTVQSLVALEGDASALAASGDVAFVLAAGAVDSVTLGGEVTRLVGGLSSSAAGLALADDGGALFWGDGDVVGRLKLAR